MNVGETEEGVCKSVSVSVIVSGVSCLFLKKVPTKSR